jgi:hypothetical protein
MGLEGAISDTGSINNGTVSTTDSVLDSELRDSISADQWIAGSMNNSTVSTTEGSILSDRIATQINDLSSDSEDEIDLHEIANRLIIPQQENYVLPQATESQFRLKMLAKQFFRNIISMCPEQIQTYLTSYYSIYAQGVTSANTLRMLHVLYRAARWLLGFLVYILHQVSSSWHLVLTYMHKYILTTDRVVNHYYCDRNDKKT